MKIVLTGVETNNKGAELMLYAILQEIERKWPDAEVFISYNCLQQGLQYIKTPLRLRFIPYERVINRTHINGVLRRIGLPIIACSNVVKADYFFDGSGFRFSDQCMLWGTTPQWWRRRLKCQFQRGAKIVFLPQAFGPFETSLTKQALEVLSHFSNAIMPRDRMSYNYLKEAGIVDMKKVKLYPDFTSLVEGVFPKEYEYLKGGICIIPNMTMISTNKIGYNDYLQLLTILANEGRGKNRPIFLINHGGQEDLELCLRCKEVMGPDVQALINLNALEIKGMISSAYMVITSRFHGLASALNSCVPSLATSWSHKYEELFYDYGMKNYVLPLDDLKESIRAFNEVFDQKENSRLRKQLEISVNKMKVQSRSMWDYIWSL